jgi:manganese-dependent inorganic pyrophosphatase
MTNTYIIGHTKPDTDAVVSAMALAFFYSKSHINEFTDLIPAITEPVNPETKFLFNKFGVTSPQIIQASDLSESDQIILVDHNEASQRLTGLELPEHESKIIEIVDHHKVNLNLKNPIALTFKPWGSTTTIIFQMMKDHGVTPNRNLASLMLAAVLSDTVGYKSATTTQNDLILGAELAQMANILDVDSFTLEIFKAKSDISSLSDEQIVKNDYKVFDFGKKTFISQLETVEQSAILDQKNSLLTAMQAVKDQQNVELLFVAITDILQVNTKLLFLSEAEKEVAEKAFGGVASDHILDVGPRMSRKKEIAPLIEKAITEKN